MRLTSIAATAVLASLGIAIGACAGPSLPTRPARTSPLSSEAAEAPPPPVATSLTQDPLAQEPASTGADGHAGDHGHDHAATPAEPVPQGAPDGGSSATEYVCPMHPDVHQSGPGRCPRCGMNLVPRANPTRPDAGPPPDSVHHQHGGEHAH